MAARPGDDLRQRHEGYLRSDLLAATLRSNREANVFVLQTARQKIFRVHSPTRQFHGGYQFGVLRHGVHTGGEKAAAGDHVAVSGLIGFRAAYVESAR
jgi:hypothetical protein